MVGGSLWVVPCLHLPVVMDCQSPDVGWDHLFPVPEIPSGHMVVIVGNPVGSAIPIQLPIRKFSVSWWSVPLGRQHGGAAGFNADGPAERRRGAWFGSSGLNAQCPTGRTRDNRSHAASEGRGRGSDLAGTVQPRFIALMMARTASRGMAGSIVHDMAADSSIM